MESNEQSIDILSKVILNGDLSKLSQIERLEYCNIVCKSLGLNPATQPFKFLLLDNPEGGKMLVLYATKSCTDQLRAIRKINLEIVGRDFSTDGMYTVTARATSGDGRQDEDVGVVSFKRSKYDPRQKKKVFYDATGDARANLIMKCHTKAKRRVTLSICGLGFIDESEIDSIPNAQIIPENKLEIVSKENDELLTELHQLIITHEIPKEKIDLWLQWAKVSTIDDMSPTQLAKVVLKIHEQFKLLEPSKE